MPSLRSKLVVLGLSALLLAVGIPPAEAEETAGLAPEAPPMDVDADGDTDVAVFRPSTGEWFVRYSSVVHRFGLPGDIPVPGHYDADPATDLAVFRPSTGQWFVQGSSASPRYGLSDDIPVPGDYNGDSRTDIAVYRPSTGQWFVRGTSNTPVFGLADDIPVPGQYDLDPETDMAVFRPSTGEWFIRGARSNPVYGLPGDIPVPGQYDADPQTDIAVFRPATGQWFVRETAGFQILGAPGDIPVPGQYDADPETDIAVFRPSTGRWIVQGASRSPIYGLGTDIPVVAPHAIRHATASAPNVYGPGPRILFDGQSLNYSPLGGFTYPQQTMTGVDLPWWNIGTSGKSWTRLFTGDAVVPPLAVRLAPHLESGQPVVMVLNGGQSDVLPRESQSGAGAFADLITYTTAAKAAGVDYVIVTTMGPIQPGSYGWGDVNPQIADYNALVRAGHATFDAVIDLAAVPGLMDPSDVSAYDDGVHYSTGGAALAADAVRPAIEAAVTALAS